MTPADLAELLRATAAAVLAEHGLDASALPDDVTVERPRNPEHGDYATNLALQLGQEGRRQPPRELAGWLADGAGRHGRHRRAPRSPGPGFLNLRLDAAAPGRHRRPTSSRPARPTATATRSPARTSTWSSSRPTRPGPIHIGGTRWAAVGDALGRLLSTPGRRGRPGVLLQRPGAQIDRFARSLLAAAKGEPAPEDGYAGDYIGEIAAQVLAERARRARACPTSEAHETFRRDRRRPDVRPRSSSRCTTFGTDFDVYFHEDSLHESGARRPRPSPGCKRVRAASTRRTAPGGCAPPTSATTRTASSSRATASPPTSPATSPTTWTSAQRGFDLCIYMLGADHHGYIARLKAAAAALGDDPDAVEVLIGQMVNLVRDGAAGADEQAGRHRHHPRRPGRRDRRRRRPVRADPLLGGHPDRHRPGPVVAGSPTKTRSTTCSTRTPGCPRWPATPPSSASTADTAHLELLDARQGGRR